jgi:hypothetical protein
VPVYVLGGVTVAATVAAIISGVFKNQAQTNANTVAKEISAHTPSNTIPCTQATSAGVAQACQDYQTDVDQTNKDATAGNVAIGVGAAALVGLAVYWVVADKAPDRGALNTPVITPIVGRSQGGLSLSMSF